MENAKSGLQLKSILSIMGLIGSLLWCLTILLREAGILLSPFILGIMPNFAAFWACIGLTFQLFPIVRKRPFDPAKLPLLCGAVFLAMLASEWVHMRFLGASFDWFDVLASLVALVAVLAVFMFTQSRERKHVNQGGQEHDV